MQERYDDLKPEMDITHSIDKFTLEEYQHFEFLRRTIEFKKQHYCEICEEELLRENESTGEKNISGSLKIKEPFVYVDKPGGQSGLEIYYNEVCDVCIKRIKKLIKILGSEETIDEDIEG